MSPAAAASSAAMICSGDISLGSTARTPALSASEIHLASEWSERTTKVASEASRDAARESITDSDFSPDASTSTISASTSNHPSARASKLATLPTTSTFLVLMTLCSPVRVSGEGATMNTRITLPRNPSTIAGHPVEQSRDGRASNLRAEIRAARGGGCFLGEFLRGQRAMRMFRLRYPAKHRLVRGRQRKPDYPALLRRAVSQTLARSSQRHLVEELGLDEPSHQARRRMDRWKENLEPRYSE